MGTSTVLITGALAGIGQATATAFARWGYRVVVSGRRSDAGEALAGELPSLGAEAAFIPADVRHEEDVRQLIDRTIERFGRLDIAINNAGTKGKPGPITEQTPETCAATFDINVLGTLLMRALVGTPLNEIGVILGHRQLATTTRYAHHAPQRLVETAWDLLPAPAVEEGEESEVEEAEAVS